MLKVTYDVDSGSIEVCVDLPLVELVAVLYEFQHTVISLLAIIILQQL